MKQGLSAVPAFFELVKVFPLLNIPRSIGILSIIIVGHLSMGCAHHRVAPPVPLDTVYPFLGASIESPGGNDWHIIQQDGSGVSFGKAGASRVQSTIASAVAFIVRFDESNDAFLKHIMLERERNDDPKRFRILSIKNTLIDYRNTRCFNYKTRSEDREATAAIGSAPQYLNIRGRICRHPDHPRLAIQVEVSHRSADKLFPGNLEGITNHFLDGLAFSPKK